MVDSRSCLADVDVSLRTPKYYVVHVHRHVCVQTCAWRSIDTCVWMFGSPQNTSHSLHRVVHNNACRHMCCNHVCRHVCGHVSMQNRVCPDSARLSCVRLPPGTSTLCNTLTGAIWPSVQYGVQYGHRCNTATCAIRPPVQYGQLCNTGTCSK